MALVKIDDFYPNYHDIVDENDIKKFDIYSSEAEKIGSVASVLVDETDGRFRYFVIDTGMWVFGKKVLLPVGLVRIDENARRIYALGLTKDQVENLPEFNDELKIDQDYEDRVRGIYRPAATTGVNTGVGSATYDRSTYSYDQDPYLYSLSDQDSESLRLYQQRLQEAKSGSQRL